jgi:hypothetical protein
LDDREKPHTQEAVQSQEPPDVLRISSVGDLVNEVALVFDASGQIAGLAQREPLSGVPMALQTDLLPHDTEGHQHVGPAAPT